MVLTSILKVLDIYIQIKNALQQTHFLCNGSYTFELNSYTKQKSYINYKIAVIFYAKTC